MKTKQLGQLDYSALARRSMAGEEIAQHVARQVLSAHPEDLLLLLQAAYEVRRAAFGNTVSIHIINNAANGFCPEDCHYCAQAKTSRAGIEEYPLKSDEEILAEAEAAYKKGAFRYCMVFAGRGPSPRRTEHLAQLVRKIKSAYPLEVCVSAGLLDEEKARVLKEAGLDRLNHNLNTSAAHYPKICTTHTHADRMKTLEAARRAGIQLCSGLIVGMGETADDILEVAYTLRRMSVESIPVNFYMPLEGNAIKASDALTPEFCLRVLCLFRLLNPKAELRVAAGRELYLRDLQALAFYPANSLFLEGYLNAQGEGPLKTLRMLKDAGFNIRSEYALDELLNEPEKFTRGASSARAGDIPLKDLRELRPYAASKLSSQSVR